MEIVVITLVLPLVIALAYWGDRRIAEKRGLDHLSKKERKELEKHRREEWVEKTAEKIPNWITVLILIVFVFLIFKGCSSINLEGNKDMEAYYMCKNFIKEQLNDPRSLDFPRPGTARIINNNNLYSVTGTFRAKNAFGAKIQNSYTCRVTKNIDKGTWTLNHLSEF
jgi:hypothetical protein